MKKVLVPVLFVLGGVVFADRIRQLPLLNHIPTL